MDLFAWCKPAFSWFLHTEPTGCLCCPSSCMNDHCRLNQCRAVECRLFQLLDGCDHWSLSAESVPCCWVSVVSVAWWLWSMIIVGWISAVLLSVGCFSCRQQLLDCCVEKMRRLCCCVVGDFWRSPMFQRAVNNLVKCFFYICKGKGKGKREFV